MVSLNVLNPIPNAGIVDERDERDEAEVVVDLVLRLAELVDYVPAHGEEVEVGAVLARVDEQVAAPERVLELLERLTRLRVLPELRDPELLQQAADELEVLREAAAVALVQPRRGRRLDDEGDELDGVQPRELRDVGELPHVVPRRHCDLEFLTPSPPPPHTSRSASRLIRARGEDRGDPRAILPAAVRPPAGHGSKNLLALGS